MRWAGFFHYEDTKNCHKEHEDNFKKESFVFLVLSFFGSSW